MLILVDVHDCIDLTLDYADKHIYSCEKNAHKNVRMSWTTKKECKYWDMKHLTSAVRDSWTPKPPRLTFSKKQSYPSGEAFFSASSREPTVL